uniref:Uncharacterized protein n=1 Tax=viral metagenome TaxID=1070528 RepID=A0A6M3JP56_9ZZZZ
MPAEITTTTKLKMQCATCKKAVNGMLKDDILELEICPRCLSVKVIEQIRSFADELEREKGKVK